MNNEELSKILGHRNPSTGVASKGSLEDTISYELFLKECRKHIQDTLKNLRELDFGTRENRIRAEIDNFVLRQKNKRVSGFINTDGSVDTVRLKEKLIDSIAHYDILTSAMQDPDIFEIRCNGATVVVERKGRVEPLTDANGKLLYFRTLEQQEVVLAKLLGEVRLTPKDAVISTSTIEGYRIAATHSSAMGFDPDDPTAIAFHSFVLRKFKKNKMSLADIVQMHRTLSDNMARFLSLAPLGRSSYVTVGQTGSGKTTTNNAISQVLSKVNERVVLLQNPNEIDLRYKDTVTGLLKNDVLHLEAKYIENPSPKDPTMENLMAHILRLSPDFVIFGELRTNKEFALGLQIAQAGHPINCTFHAGSPSGAIERFLISFQAENGNIPSDLALRMLTSLIDIIIVQDIMKDGKRRITHITEVIGVKKDNPNEPELNDLFVFEQTGDTEYDSQGRVKQIHGVHKRVGIPSESLLRKWGLSGINQRRYDFMLNPISPNEEETYTGVNIENYNMVLGVDG